MEGNAEEDITRRAKNLIKLLKPDLDAARLNWALFVSGDGNEQGSRRSLHELLGSTDELRVFRHIIHTAALDTVLVLARLTDPGGKNRQSLTKLKSLLGPRQSAFVEKVRLWHGEDNTGSLGKSDAERAEYELAALNSRISDFLKSDGVRKIRDVRNKAIAHKLPGEIEDLEITSIRTALTEAGEIISKASFWMAGGQDYPEQDNESLRAWADKFWDTFERGLRR